MNRLSTLIFVLCLVGCNVTRRDIRKLERIAERSPELFEVPEIQVDTVEKVVETKVPVPAKQLDSAFVFDLLSTLDSFEVENDGLKAKVTYLESREFGTKTIVVEVEAAPDTLPVEVVVPCPSYTPPDKPQPCRVTVVKQKNGYPWWYLLISGVVGGVLSWAFGLNPKSIRRTLEGLTGKLFKQ